MAGAGAGGRRDDRLGGGRLRQGGVKRLEGVGLRAAPIFATRRSTTRSANTPSRKVPVMLVVGRREAEERTVSLRRLGSKDQAS